MTAQTVGGAIARRDKELQLVNWLRDQQDDIAMAAASHLKPSTIVRVAQGALRKDPKLMAAAVANPQSLIHCLLDAARLGHEPGTDQYWLIPFGDEVTGIEGYKGIIERMYRAGGVSVVVAEVVRERDSYRSLGPTTPPVHEFDEFADPDSRGPLRGTYAYALMADGRCSQVIRLGRAEVMKHKAKSRGSERSDSPWKCWEESMWKKTPLRGLEPYVPTSSEWLNARATAAATARATVHAAPGWASAAPEPHRVIPSEVVAPELEQAPEPEQAAPRPSRPRGQQRRNPQAVPGEVVPPEDAPWPGDAAPAKPARNADPVTGEVIPDPAGDDPRAAVLTAFDALKVAGPEIPAYLTRLSGHPYASVESLSSAAAGWFTAKLAGLGSRDELEAAAVAAEAKREAPGAE